MANKRPKTKIAHSDPSASHHKVTPGKVSHNSLQPVFSFRYLDIRHKKFSHTAISEAAEWHLLVEQLKSMSTMTWGAIKNARQFYAHEISETKKVKPQHMDSMPPVLQINPPFQFKGFKECRVVGFFEPATGVFQIVWFDRKHDIYPDDSR